jgi:hypothetical protein
MSATWWTEQVGFVYESIQEYVCIFIKYTLTIAISDGTVWNMFSRSISRVCNKETDQRICCSHSIFKYLLQICPWHCFCGSKCRYYYDDSPYFRRFGWKSVKQEVYFCAWSAASEVHILLTYDCSKYVIKRNWLLPLSYSNLQGPWQSWCRRHQLSSWNYTHHIKVV